MARARQVLLVLILAAHARYCVAAKEFVYETGYTVFEDENDAFRVGDNGSGCKYAATTGNRASIASFLIEEGYPEQEFFYIRVLSGSTSQERMTVSPRFAVVKSTKLSKFQYLPYRAGDVERIFHYEVKMNMTHEAEKFKSFSISLSDETCPEVIPQAVDDVSHGFPDDLQNILMTLLLHATLYNPHAAPSLDDHSVCFLTYGYTDMPFRLTRCCGPAHHKIHDTDLNRTHVHCSSPDGSRQTLSIVALALGVVGFLFLPMLIKNFPTDPYHHRKTCKIMCGRSSCCGHNTKINDGGCDIQMKGTESRRGDAASEVTIVTVELDSEPTRQNEVADIPTVEVDIERPEKTSLVEEEKEEEERVFLNWDSEYKFSLRTMLSYIIFFPPRHRIRDLVYRFIMLAVPRFLASYLWLITDVYYESVLKEFNFLNLQTFMGKNFYGHFYPDEYAKLHEKDLTSKFYAYVDITVLLYVPLVFSSFNMILLYHVLIRPKDLSELLLWNDEWTVEGGRKLWRNNPKTRSWLAKLHLNLKYRLSRLGSVSFWTHWWQQRVCRYSPGFRRKKTLKCGKEAARQFLWLLLMVPLELVYALVHILPIFAIFSNIITNPRRVLTWGCAPKNKHAALALLALSAIMTLVGILMHYWMILVLCCYFTLIVIFLTIDILRNSSTMLSTVVILISALLYVVQSFSDFRDRYLKLKVDIIDECDKMASEQELIHDTEYILRRDRKTPLFLQDSAGRISIPSCAFHAVCEHVMPYQREVVRTLIRLFSTLGLMSFIFVIVIVFQVFEEFSSTGEAVMVALTVSLPKLLGLLTTDAQMSVRCNAIAECVRAIVEEMFERRKREHTTCSSDGLHPERNSEQLDHQRILLESKNGNIVSKL